MLSWATETSFVKHIIALRIFLEDDKKEQVGKVSHSLYENKIFF